MSTEQRPAVIDARRLFKRFGKLVAVNDLTLQIRAGEVVGFLGPNGAGKRTTIRMLMGFIRPSSGEGLVLGGRLWDRPALRRDVGYLPGDFRVDPGLTGWDLLSWFGSLRGGFDRKRVERLAGRKFGELSKGNRQKVGIIQAFMHEPKVLILDEPTSGLDPLLQRWPPRPSGGGASRCSGGPSVWGSRSPWSPFPTRPCATTQSSKKPSRACRPACRRCSVSTAVRCIYSSTTMGHGIVASKLARHSGLDRAYFAELAADQSGRRHPAA